MKLSEALVESYLDTRIEVEHDGLYRPATEAVDLIGAPLHVITAANPFSRRLELKRNNKRNARLRRALIELGVDPHRAVGRWPGSSRFERSFAVTGLDRSIVRALGREFEQHAVFELAPTLVVVLSCFSDWEVSGPHP